MNREIIDGYDDLRRQRVRYKCYFKGITAAMMYHNRSKLFDDTVDMEKVLKESLKTCQRIKNEINDLIEEEIESHQCDKFIDTVTKK